MAPLAVFDLRRPLSPWTGTAVNDFGTMLPGNGRSLRFTGAYYVRAREGKIVEHAGVEDGLSLLRRLRPDALSSQRRPDVRSQPPPAVLA